MADTDDLDIQSPPPPPVAPPPEPVAAAPEADRVAIAVPGDQDSITVTTGATGPVVYPVKDGVIEVLKEHVEHVLAALSGRAV